MKKYWTIFTNGLLTENPLLVLMIGLCSSLAVTTRLENGLGMGLAMTFVLVMSEIIISLFRKLIPMGVFIPLIVVNCIIMGRVESFASKRSMGESFCDALGMGFGYLWVLCGISFVRELLGAGSILGKEIIPEAYRIGFFTNAPGGFFVFGMFIAGSIGIRQLLNKKVRGGTAQ